MNQFCRETRVFTLSCIYVAIGSTVFLKCTSTPPFCRANFNISCQPRCRRPHSLPSLAVIDRPQKKCTAPHWATALLVGERQGMKLSFLLKILPKFVHTYNSIMEGIAPHEEVGTQVMRNEIKANAISHDREMGNGVDIATIERVYRYSISLQHHGDSC